MRIGHGYDVHKFDQTSTACLIRLGGVDVPADQALLAHSDGDVVLHALCDALLGAAALGDIGEHFPDTDKQWKGVDSSHLLRHVTRLIQLKGYRIENVDITIAAQAPKLSPYKKAMIEAIAKVLQINVDQVNVKATTTERLGFVGRKEGIAVDAVCLLSADKT